MHDPTREVLGRVEAAIRDARDEPIIGGGKQSGRGPIVGNREPAAAPKPPRITLLEEDGEPVRRFTADGPFEAWLWLEAKDGRTVAGEPALTLPVVITLEFPNADVAQEHLRPIGHAVAILNDAFARAFAARDDAVPDAATCRHHVRFERFRRALPMQATCDRCLTVLADDAAAWLDDHGYGHLTDRGLVSDRETAAAVIEEAANRGR